MAASQIDLIKLLSSSGKPVTGKQLASELGISQRSVVNYVRAINQQAHFALIESSRRGYALARGHETDVSRLLNSEPKGHRERALYIYEQCFFDGDAGTDIYGLSDDLGISISLLRQDIRKMNEAYSYLDVRAYTKAGRLYIEGTEQNKRHLMNHLVMEGQGGNMLTLGMLRDFFSAKQVDEMLALLERAYASSGFFLNEFAKLNVLLHLLTVVDRVTSGNPIVSQDADDESCTEEADDPEARILDEICAGIESMCDVTLGPADRHTLYYVLRSNSTLNPRESKELIDDYLGENLLGTLKAIVAETEDTFGISLSDEEFLTRFFIHVKALAERCNNGAQILCPLKSMLRESSPFLYDVSWFIISRLMDIDILKSRPNEDELAFIVIHIGSGLMKTNIMDQAVRCALLVPRYLGIERRLADAITGHCGDRAVITQIANAPDDLLPEEYELIISAFEPDGPTSAHDVIYVSPFISSQNLDAIDDAVDSVMAHRAGSYLINNFDSFFSSENFIYERGCSTRDDTIRELCDLLHEHGYVNSEFVDEVFLREEAASTAYDDFAIPHSTGTDALESAVAVKLSEGGVSWQGKTVHLVLLMAVEADSLNSFQVLYETLSRVLVDSRERSHIQNSTSFEEFKEALFYAARQW